MQLQTTSPESKFPDEYIGVIFRQINQHWKSYWTRNTFYGTRYLSHGSARYAFNLYSL